MHKTRMSYPYHPTPNVQDVKLVCQQELPGWRRGRQTLLTVFTFAGYSPVLWLPGGRTHRSLHISLTDRWPYLSQAMAGCGGGCCSGFCSHEQPRNLRSWLRDCVDETIPWKDGIVVLWTRAVRWTVHIPSAATRTVENSRMSVSFTLSSVSRQAMLFCSFETVRWHDMHSDPQSAITLKIVKVRKSVKGSQ